MKSFSEFLANKQAPTYEWFTFIVDKYSVHILHDSDEPGNLQEARLKGVPLGGTYSAQLHRPHASGGQVHLHIYARNNQLFSINIDGTAHDRSHGARIPSRVAKAIADTFPNFRLPPNRLIESAPAEIIDRCHEQLLLG